MQNFSRMRTNTLRTIYAVTAVIACIIGTAILFAPLEVLNNAEDVWNVGIFGSMELAIGLMATIGFFRPYRMLPILLHQMTYKAIWLVAVVAPLTISTGLDGAQVGEAALYVVFILADAVAIPFAFVFGVDADGRRATGTPGLETAVSSS